MPAETHTAPLIEVKDLVTHYGRRKILLVSQIGTLISWLIS